MLILVIFFKCSLCILICECTCLFFIFVVEVFFSFFCICWVERNFFWLAVFGENLLAGDVYSSVALDRHVQDRQHVPTHLRPGAVTAFSYYIGVIPLRKGQILVCDIEFRDNTFLLTVCPLDTGCKLNVHKTFRGRPGRLLNVLCTFNLHPVFRGQFKI